MDSIYGFTTSNNETIYFYLSEEDSEDSDDNKIENPDFGPRSNPIQIISHVDFINNCLTGCYLLNKIEKYEIWEELGFYCLSISYDEKDFIISLKELPSATYKLILRGNNFSLIGYYYR